MFSLCRLCANCKDQTELRTQISEIEAKLTYCCGWFPSENETQMPSKACDACVDQLQKSWCFVENIKTAESKLNKLISEQKQIVPCETTSNEAKLTDSMKLDPDICSIEFEEFEHFDNEAFDDSVKCSDAESSHSFEDLLVEVNRKSAEEKKLSKDHFLAQLDDEDRLADGTISVNGVSKLEKLFPEMKAMSWTECEYNCEKCNRIFKGPHNFYAHNRSMHIGEVQTIVFKCIYCKSKHMREYTLSQHMAKKHFPHLKFRCWYCTDYFWDHRTLITHRNLHTNIEYNCELCDQVFMGRVELYSHISQVHQKKRWAPDPEAKFTCDICKKDFATKWRIRSHMLQHCKKFDYICDQCGWKFLTKGNLKGHLQTTHSTVKPFACDQCESRFKTKHHLIKHAKLHDEFKPFVCTVCQKRFRQAYGLTVHKRSHDGIYPYDCKYCGRKFRHTSTLKTHERIHTAEKPYLCSQCDYRSTNWPNLNKHSLRIHSIDLRTKKN